MPNTVGGRSWWRHACAAAARDAAATRSRRVAGAAPGRPPRTEVAALNVTIDRDACIGRGACEESCPDVFEVGDDGVAMVIAKDLSGQEDCVLAAAEDCPQSAIVVDGE